MPLWRIFAHPTVFTPAQKQALATDITQLYMQSGLPAFYVDVIFVDVPKESMFVGGEPHDNFVRIAIEQIARTMPDPNAPGAEGEKAKKQRTGWMDKINGVLKPHIIDRPELKWEHHIYETPRDLWRVQGIDPPPARSEAEKEWFRTNRAERWEKL